MLNKKRSGSSPEAARPLTKCEFTIQPSGGHGTTVDTIGIGVRDMLFVQLTGNIRALPGRTGAAGDHSFPTAFLTVDLDISDRSRRILHPRVPLVKRNLVYLSQINVSFAQDAIKGAAYVPSNAVECRRSTAPLAQSQQLCRKQRPRPRQRHRRQRRRPKNGNVNYARFQDV